MSLNLGLHQAMRQSLVMSARMQQRIKLLQLNHLEMVGAIQEAILENPTLEASSNDSVDRATEALLREQTPRADDMVGSQEAGGNDGVDWNKFLEQLADRRGTASLGGTIHEELPPIEANLTYGESLAEHLLWQLQMVHLTDEERKAADVICHNLDHRGYLVTSLEEVATTAEVPVDEAESALTIVQALDPLGCGSRDLAECLILQARILYSEDENFERILSSHLANLERRNYAAIAKDLSLDLEDVIEYHRMIQELEPHPGRAFGHDEPRYISPDLYVEKEDGEWRVHVNDEGVPTLKISSYYQKIAASGNEVERRYLQDKLRGAQFLIESIRQRRSTIRRVMESIIKHQYDFFEGGASYLRPLVLQDVATELNVHMSTVSRVTTNKYVHTPHGILELKFFFSAGVRQNSGEDIAAEAIKTRLKTLLQGENPKKPLSDQQLADLLKKEGVKVARRTVAKDREAIGILPSSQRKQMF